MLIYSPAKIVALREERGLSQSELARRAKLSAPSVWALEAGETKMPKYQTLKSLAAALGVPIQALMADEQPGDIDERILAAASSLNPQNKAALLAAVVALLDSQKRK
jgi:transcriptional regulator with XRE-family HTH domain